MSSIKCLARSSLIAKSCGHIKQSSAMGVLPTRMASRPTRKNSNLEGRVALVTAGTCGIGLEISRRLAENGAKVVVSSRKQKNVDHAVALLRADGHHVSAYSLHNVYCRLHFSIVGSGTLSFSRLTNLIY